MKNIALITSLVALGLSSQLSAAPLTKVVFHTDWKAQAEHGGFYEALALGLYKKAGLDVVIRPGGPQTDNTRLLAAGAIDLAMVSDSFQALTLASKGADVKIIMASFQKDPETIMAHPGTGAASLAAWHNRPMYMDDAFKFSYWPWVKARFGFTDRQSRPYAFSLTPWLQDKFALQEGYLSSEPFTATKGGVTPQLVVLADAGYPGYAGMVATTGKYQRAHPDSLRKFVQASQAGWKAYLTGDPSAGNALIKRDNPEMQDDLLKYALNQMKARGIVISGDAVRAGPGVMTAARWALIHKEMAAVGLYPKTLDPAKIYDLEFLAKP